MARSKAKVTGKCALCRKVGELKHSHIIPEFMYRPLYGPTHTIHLASSGDWNNSELLQKGAREHLLCGGCEQKFSRYEKHAADKLFQDVEIIHRGPAGLSGRVDYKLFKLFQLSILWRIGITSLSAFSRVHLGKHEKRLRHLLLDDNPGKFDHYGCMLLKPSGHPNIFNELIMHGFTAKRDGIDYPVFVMGGLLWIYCVSQLPIDSKQAEFFLQSNGELRILTRDPGIGSTVVNQIVASIKFHTEQSKIVTKL